MSPVRCEEIASASAPCFPNFLRCGSSRQAIVGLVFGLPLYGSLLISFSYSLYFVPLRGPPIKIKPKAETGSDESNHRGNCQRRKESSTRPHLKAGGHCQWLRLVTQSAEETLEFLNLGVAFAGTIPKIIVFHNGLSHFQITRPLPQAVLTNSYGRAAAPIPIFSRSIFTPRCKFTLTEAEVNPVRRAISGPVMPSTNLSTSVSR